MSTASTSTRGRGGCRIAAHRSLRHALAGTSVGLAIYLALLIAHLVQYRTIGPSATRSPASARGGPAIPGTAIRGS
jgi:hypothetical protein